MSFDNLTLNEWIKMYKPLNNLIVQASTVIECDGFSIFPIGMQYNYDKLPDKIKKDIQVGLHQQLVLCAVNSHTDVKRRFHKDINRISILQTLDKNGIKNKILNYQDYFTELSDYKYVISPEGNGIDCHRHYEALLCGCIPIVEENELIMDKYKNLPILYTKDYSEITEEYLNEKYEEFLEKKYDFSKLFLDHYEEEVQETIKMYGNYWCNLFNKRNVYDIIYSHKDCKGNPLQIKLKEYFDKKNGFFIELGANDGLFQSNTAYLEKEKGWSGILIEPSLSGYEKCKMNRPNSICLNYACVSSTFTDDYIQGDFGDNHPMSSVNGKRLNRTNLVSVKTNTLEKILDSNARDVKIDFLSLDAEGYELEILKGLNLSKYRPMYMLVEIYKKDYEEIVKYLNEFNYKLKCNLTNYNKVDNPTWDGTHNDYLFYDIKKGDVM